MRRIEAQPLPRYFPKISLPSIGWGLGLLRRRQSALSIVEEIPEVQVPLFTMESLFEAWCATGTTAHNQFMKSFLESRLSRFFRPLVDEGKIVGLGTRPEYPQGVHVEISDGEVRFKLMQPDNNVNKM